MLTNEKTIYGRPYMADFKSNNLPTIVYLHGSGSIGRNLDHIKGCAFFKLWYSAFKDQFNFFFPLQFDGFSGWENMIDGYTSGGHFTREMIAKHSLTKVVVTGHSAGATFETLAFLQDQIQGFAPVAGRGLSYQRVKECGRLGIPVLCHHGTLDTVRPCHYAAGVQACNWLRAGGGNPEFVALEGVGHGSDSHAYKPTSRLKPWIDSLFVAEEPVPEPEPEPERIPDITNPSLSLNVTTGVLTINGTHSIQTTKLS